MRNYKIVIFVVAYLAAFAISAWAGYYFYVDYAVEAGHKKAAAADADIAHFQTDMAYVDLPRINLTLPSGGSATGNVRMEISLEVDNKYAPVVQGYRPRITDQLLHYAQNLKYDDLAAAKSTVWLKRDLLAEVKKVSGSPPIRDIVFRQLIVL